MTVLCHPSFKSFLSASYLNMVTSPSLASEGGAPSPHQKPNPGIPVDAEPQGAKRPMLCFQRLVGRRPEAERQDSIPARTCDNEGFKCPSRRYLNKHEYTSSYRHPTLRIWVLWTCSFLCANCGRATGNKIRWDRSRCVTRGLGYQHEVMSIGGQFRGRRQSTEVVLPQLCFSRP